MKTSLILLVLILFSACAQDDTVIIFNNTAGKINVNIISNELSLSLDTVWNGSEDKFYAIKTVKSPHKFFMSSCDFDSVEYNDLLKKNRGMPNFDICFKAFDTVNCSHSLNFDLPKGQSVYLFYERLGTSFSSIDTLIIKGEYADIKFMNEADLRDAFTHPKNNSEHLLVVE